MKKRNIEDLLLTELKFCELKKKQVECNYLSCHGSSFDFDEINRLNGRIIEIKILLNALRDYYGK